MPACRMEMHIAVISRKGGEGEARRKKSDNVRPTQLPYGYPSKRPAVT